MRYLLYCAMLLGQTEPNIPEREAKEIRRLGTFVNSVGDTHGTTVEDAIQDAFKPPVDDSYKWYFTLIAGNTVGTKELNPASAALKRDIENSEVFKSWVDTVDKSKSPVHYNYRNISADSDLHKDFIANIKDQLHELPAILIQPPRNGRFGKNETVVGILPLPKYQHGEETIVENTLRQIIVNYITAKYDNGELKEFPNDKISGSHEQSKDGLDFLSRPSGKKSPYRTVPDGAGNPRRLSILDIESLAPGAPRDFITFCYDGQLTRDEVIEEYTALQADDTSKVVHTIKDDQDFHSANHQTFMIVIMVCMLGIGVVHTFMMIRARQDAKQMRTLTEAEHSFLVDTVKRFDTANATNPTDNPK